MIKPAAAIAVLPVAAALALAPAMAAFALAPLPDTDEIYSAGYYEEGDLGSGSFWQVLPGAPSTVETIATPHAEPESITDGAYSALSGVSYLIGYGYGPECELWSVDTVTGAYTFVAPITQTHETNEDVPYLTEDCNAFEVLDNGTAYVTIFNQQLYTLDLTTGVATFVADINDGEDFFTPSTISTDVTTGTTYALDWEGYVATLDLSTGLVTFIGQYLELSDTHDSDFDSAGTLWVTTWLEEFSNLVSIADPATPAVNEVDAPIEGWQTDSIWIKPAVVEPALAATGVDVTPYLLGAAGLFAVGAVIVLRRRTAQE